MVFCTKPLTIFQKALLFLPFSPVFVYLVNNLLRCHCVFVRNSCCPKTASVQRCHQISLPQVAWFWCNSSCNILRLFIMERSLILGRKGDFWRFRRKAQCGSSLFLVAKLKTRGAFSLPTDCIRWGNMHLCLWEKSIHSSPCFHVSKPPTLWGLGITGRDHKWLRVC